MIDPVIQLTLRAGLATLFTAAAWHKLSDRTRFAASLRAYELLPRALLSPIARFLPALECCIAIGLLCAPSQAPAALASMALLTGYTGAIAVNLARGRREIDCGCFASALRVPLSSWLIARNLALIGASALAVMPIGARSLNWVDLFTVVAAVIMLSLLSAAAQRLAQSGPALLHSRGPR